ncbi:MAG: glycine cleavage system aminomethyltransferase GcvT [Pseudomonadales bacterium]|nr:glycine cleavage system aminomethyltransferase GcvT [Pseudomonadales bacterium]
MGQRTPIYAQHINAGAKMVDFGGWDMPIHYGSQLEEHHVVRRDAGICDVSHMTVIDLCGPDATAYLRYLLANDVARLDMPGKALYSAMLNEAGGVLDDLIVYLDTGPNGVAYRIVVNCATREKDLAWMTKQTQGFDCQLTERPELAILAIQGPRSLSRVSAVVEEAHAAVISRLKPFVGAWSGNWFIARTGYTGEKGVEIILPGEDAQQLWQQLVQAGIKPVGLGARDTLRLEAGMNLYGSDMNEQVTPLEANMATTVSFDGDRGFLGRARLEAQLAAGIEQELTGLVLLERGVLRAHYPLFSAGEQVGEITSGAFSPTLEHSIALARVKSGVGDLEVEIRGKRLPVHKVKPPFARNGKQVYKLD